MSDSQSDSIYLQKPVKPISVYDYPEHLNPFYGDENHKRLRFWTLSKNNKNGIKRSNSLSLVNLKDLWTFKTFRMKRKSSSLGINKTSESPPPLRKYNDIDYSYDSNCNTLNPSYRQTLDSHSNLRFQRNTPYRATVGSVDSPSKAYDSKSEIIFNRNDFHRHTTSQKSYNSSVTPILGNKYSTNEGNLSLRTSHTSLKSTNPFDEDDDIENTSPNCFELKDTIVENGGIIKPPVRRNYRKKRRAPPPPILINNCSTVSRVQEQFDSPDNIEEVELKITEENENEGLPTLQSLANDIETLTKNIEEQSLEKEDNEEKGEPEMRENINEVDIKKENIVFVKDCSSVIKETQHSNDVINVIPQQKPESENLVETKLKEDDTLPVTLRNDSDSLSRSKITKDPRTVFEIQYVALKDSNDKDYVRPFRRNSSTEKEFLRKEFMHNATTTFNRSNSIDEGLVNTKSDSSVFVSRRRRSVKEIIEAINRNQSMLQATNYVPLSDKYRFDNSYMLNQNRRLDDL